MSPQSSQTELQGHDKKGDAHRESHPTGWLYTTGWMKKWHKKILFSTEAKIQAVSWGEDPEINNFYSALAHWAKGLQCH